MMQKQKGFTIIELIVVVAIIAILATIVLVSVSQYISPSRVAVMKTNMQQLSGLGAQYMYDGMNSTYSGFCSNSSYGYKVTKAMAAMGLSTLSFYCMDYTGYSYLSAGSATTSSTTTSGCNTSTSYPNGRWFSYFTYNGTTYCIDSEGGASTTYSNGTCSCT